MGLLVATAVVLSTVNGIDLFGVENADEEIFRTVAGWLQFAALLGIVTEFVFMIFRILYFTEVIISHYTIFAIKVSRYVIASNLDSRN